MDNWGINYLFLFTDYGETQIGNIKRTTNFKLNLIIPILGIIYHYSNFCFEKSQKHLLLLPEIKHEITCQLLVRTIILKSSNSSIH